MLVNDDLPDEWEVKQSPIPHSSELDELLQLNNPGGIHSWDEIQHRETGVRVLLRMAPPKVEDNRIVDDGALVTGVVVLPANPGERVTAANMRFPLGSIESAANLRRVDTFPAIKAALAAGTYTPPDPIGRPDGSDEFYARVALLWRHFADDENPTERLREKNKVPLSTAQRWVTEARKRKLLPPGRRGRAK